jgi:prephenate dehydrogenase
LTLASHHGILLVGAGLKESYRTMSFRRISILGLGLIGGSVALAIQKHLSDCDVTGYDVDSGAMREALGSGAVDRVVSSPALACEEVQFIVLCVPVGRVEKVLAAMAPHLKPGVCVTDVGSTKRSVVEAAQRLLPAGVHFVGSHPMAGGERHGFSAARADLFDGAICITTPTPSSDPRTVEQVEQFWRKLGMEIRRMPAEQHDHLVAQISHLPHVLASALIQSATDDALAISGPGFRDVTRIAASDPALWRDILLDNADEVRGSIARFRAELNRLEALLKPGNAEELRNWLAEAAQRRNTVGKSAG